MSLKTVSVIEHDGRELHKFTCHTVDITTHMILFEGVPARHGDKSVSVGQVERIIFDVNQLEGLALIHLVDSKKLIRVTW